MHIITVGDSQELLMLLAGRSQGPRWTTTVRAFGKPWWLLQWQSMVMICMKLQMANLQMSGREATEVSWSLVEWAPTTKCRSTLMVAWHPWSISYTMGWSELKEIAAVLSLSAEEANRYKHFLQGLGPTLHTEVGRQAFLLISMCNAASALEQLCFGRYTRRLIFYLTWTSVEHEASPQGYLP